MKKRIFVVVLLSIIFALIVNTAGNSFGEALKAKLIKSELTTVFLDIPIDIKTASSQQLLDIINNPLYRDKITKANLAVSNKVFFWLSVSLFIQAILMLLIVYISTIIIYKILIKPAKALPLV